jgi:hypothetical protein
VRGDCDPEYQCYSELFSDGDSASDERGDYAEEEEQRINNALEEWKKRNTKIEAGSTNNPLTAFRKMQAQEEGGADAPPTTKKKEVVYKGSDILQKDQVIGQNSIQNGESASIQQQTNINVNHILHPPVVSDSLSLSSGFIILPTYCSKYVRKDLLAHLPALTTGGCSKPEVIKEVFLRNVGVIEEHRTIEATIIVVCMKRGICYFNLVQNLFPTMNGQKLYRVFDRLKSRQIIEVKDKNNGFQNQAAIYEKAIKRKIHHLTPFGKEIVYYGLTDSALRVVGVLGKELEKIVPNAILHTIKDRYMKDQLLHTEQEKRFKEQQELKTVTNRISELWLSVRYKYGKEADAELMRRIEAKYGPEAAKNMTPLQYQQTRLAILEAMVKEANKRR